MERGRVPDSMRAIAVEIEIVRTFSALEGRREAWNRLVERAQTNTVFQTYECHASWWKAFGAGVKLFVVLTRVGRELLGIVPLMLTERLILGRRYRVVQFIGLSGRGRFGEMFQHIPS